MGTRVPAKHGVPFMISGSIWIGLIAALYQGWAEISPPGHQASWVCGENRDAASDRSRPRRRLRLRHRRFALDGGQAELEVEAVLILPGRRQGGAVFPLRRRQA